MIVPDRGGLRAYDKPVLPELSGSIFLWTQAPGMQKNRLFEDFPCGGVKRVLKYYEAPQREELCP